MEGHFWSVALVLELYFRVVVGPVVGFASSGLSVRCGGGGCSGCWVGVGAGLFRRAMRRKERLGRVLLVAVRQSWI